MADPITVLTDDHRAIEGLFVQVEGDPKPDKEVVGQIVKALSVHDGIEKQFLYPEVRRLPGSGEDLADRSIEEHDEVAKTLLKIEKADAESNELAADLALLMALVRAHVEEEETEIFPALRSSISPDDFDALGDNLRTAKTYVPTRPHPMAPSGPVGNLVAGAVAAPLDRLKDGLQGR